MTIDKRSPIHVSAWRAIIGYVPQNPYILDETVANNIAFGIQQELIDHKKIEQLIRDVDLEKWIMELPEGIHTRIGEKGASISGGQRQRIALARALYHNAQLLLLDEVTNQLDSITQKEVINRILSFDDPNRTVVMITHSPDWLNRFDKVYDLRNGELKIKELVAQAVQG